MDTQLIPIEQFQTFLVVLSRVAGFVGAIPVYFSAQTPARIKTGLTVLIAILLFPIMEPAVGEISLAPVSFGLLVVSELLLGLLLGLVARLIFTAVEFGALSSDFKWDLLQLMFLIHKIKGKLLSFLNFKMFFPYSFFLP